MEATLQRLVLKTDVLKDIISKAVKACSFMDSFPVTSMLEINTEPGKLFVKTTDNINILTLEKAMEVDGGVHIVVDAKLFSSLVSKLTTPITEISIENNQVIVKANGKYELPLVSEQDGSAVSLPGYEFDSSVPSNSISTQDLRSIMTMSKTCKSEMKELPSIFNYYMDSERVLTTDSYKMCNNPIKLFNNPVCLPPSLVDMIPLVADDSGVTIQENSTSVLFTSANGSLYGRKATQEDLEQFPAQDLIASLNESYDNECVINRTLLINALERTCLFTEGFDSNSITLTFTKDQITLTTKRNNTSESIKYLQPSNFDGEFSINIDAVFLKNQLSSFPKEDILIKFGNESGIVLVCDNITQLSSSLDEGV